MRLASRAAPPRHAAGAPTPTPPRSAPGAPGLRPRLAWRWVRGSLRRPGRGLLVIGGLLAMSLAVTAALVGSDTLEEVFVADAEAQWGSVDVVVTPAGGRLMDESLARLMATEGIDHSPAWAPRLLLPTIAELGGRREPLARLIGVAAEEQLFDAPLTGQGHVDVLALEPEEVVVNARLAGRLGLEVGDDLDLIIAVPETDWRSPGGRILRERDAEAVPWTATVAGIADDAGLADLGRTANVLTRLDTVQRITGLEGKVSGLHAAARDHSAEASEELADAYDDLARRVGLAVTEVRQEALDIADDEAGQFGGIFMTLAFLVVLGSAALTVNLVTLLGQERSREVALLRATGAQRRTVRRLLLAEGATYALAAAVLGAILAVPLGRALAQTVADHFAAIELGRGREFVTTVPDPSTGALTTGVVVVLVIALLAVAAGARRVARLDMEQILRGLPPTSTPPEPAGLRRPLLTAGSGLLLLGMGLTAAVAGDFLRFSGLSLLLTAWWLHSRRVTDDRVTLDRRAALGGVAWFVAAPALLGDFTTGVETGFGILAVAGAGAVTCATVLIGTRMRGVMRFVRGYLPRGRWQAATRTAGAWAEHQRGRAGTVIGLIGIVLFMVAAMAVLGRATAIDVERQRGGFDVIATSVAPLDRAVIAEVDDLAALVTLEHSMIGEQAFATRDDDDRTAELRWPIRVIRASHDLATTQAFGLADALPGYDSAAAAIDEVISRGRGAVLDRYSRPEGARPGDDVVIDLGRGPQELELIAVLDTYLLGGVIIGAEPYDELFGSRGQTMALAAATDRARAPGLAEGLDDAGRDVGLVALTVDEIAEDITRINATFTDIFVVLLQVGLAVALVAVAALVGRALRERRAAVALLRAIGFRRRDVVTMILAEPLLLAATGIVIGLVAGLGSLRLLFWVGFADLAFTVAWGQIAATAALSLGLVALGCLLPALAAARRPIDSDLRDLG